MRAAGGWLAAGYMALLLGLGSLPELQQPFELRLWDKAAHAAAYAVLGTLLCWAFRGRWVRALVVATAYGAMIEGLQAVLPTRTAEAGDLLANALGAAAAGGAWALVLHRSKNRRRHAT